MSLGRMWLQWIHFSSLWQKSSICSEGYCISFIILSSRLMARSNWQKSASFLTTCLRAFVVPFSRHRYSTSALASIFESVSLSLRTSFRDSRLCSTSRGRIFLRVFEQWYILSPLLSKGFRTFRSLSIILVLLGLTMGENILLTLFSAVVGAFCEDHCEISS